MILKGCPDENGDTQVSILQNGQDCCIVNFVKAPGAGLTFPNSSCSQPQRYHYFGCGQFLINLGGFGLGSPL